MIDMTEVNKAKIAFCREQWCETCPIPNIAQKGSLHYGGGCHDWMRKHPQAALAIMRGETITTMKPVIRIDRVIFDGPATIVFCSDDTKTVVKCMDGDPFAYDVGVAMATLKKVLGKSYAPYRSAVKKMIKEALDKKNASK